MSDLSPSLFEDDSPLAQLESLVFDYRLLSEDKREFVLQKTDETQVLLKRTAENIILIGRNLQEVKGVLSHGMFLPWLQSEFDMSHQSAYRFMRVADKFADKFNKLLNLNFAASALYLLSETDAPEEVVSEALQRAESGEKITHALAKQIIAAQEAIKKAQEAEAEAHANEIIAQQSLFQSQQSAESRIAELNTRIAALQQEMTELQKPEVRIEEKEVVPESLTKEIEDLRAQVEQITTERDSEKARAEGFARRVLVEHAAHKDEERKTRIREQWHSTASELQMAVRRSFAQWPSVLDTQTFETDEWAEVDHIIESVQRVIEECQKLRRRADSMVVQANGSPYALTTYDVES